MKTIFLSFICIAVINASGFTQSTWNLMPALTGSLYSLHFANNQTGWVVGTAGVFKTTNGGINWTLQSSDSTRGVCFINGNTGIIGGHSPKRTSDGGATWTNLSRFADTLVYDINRADSIILFACGGRPGTSYGVIWRSIDAGLNWTRVYHYSNAGNYLSVQFINYNTGWATTHTGGIYRTTNGGQSSIMTWSTSAYYDIWFVDQYTGWVTNNSTTIRKTTNGGEGVWTNQPLPNSGGYALHFFNSSDGRIVGPSGYIMRTVNGGTNWFMETSPTTQQLNGIFFTGNDTGYICGNNGTILKTINGSMITNIAPVSGKIPKQFSLSQNYPNPFNPRTIINYQLPVTNFVKLAVYDLTGKEAAVLVNDVKNAGTYSAEFDGSNLSSGVYFYKLITSNFTETKRMILLK